MASSLCERDLYQSDVVRVTDVRCRPRDANCGAEEFCPRNMIVFPRTGFFVRHVEGREIVGDVNSVLFFRRGEIHRVSHPVAGGDDCTTLIFPPSALADAFATHDSAAGDQPGEPFRLPRIRSERSLFLAMQRLRAALRPNAPTPWVRDTLELDETALRALDALAESASRQASSRRPADGHRTETVRAHRDLVENVRVLLTSHMGEKLTLSGIAHRVHSSPFHLARVFRHGAGVTIHRYLMELRLRTAMERLAEGESDLTQLALSLGFFSHSHFTDSFQREFGLPPRDLRKLFSSR